MLKTIIELILSQLFFVFSLGPITSCKTLDITSSYGDEIHNKAVKQMENLVGLCKNAHIHYVLKIKSYSFTMRARFHITTYPDMQ